MLQAAILVVFPFCMAFAIVSDMVSMTIANRVSVILVVSFALIAPFTGMGWADYGLHFAAGALVLAVTFAMFAIGGMGGGDAKLMTATAVWFGLSMTLLQYLVYASLIGGALTLLLLIYRKSPISVLTGNNLLLRQLADDKAGIPYGIALGLSALMVCSDAPLMAWAIERLAAG